MPGSSGVRSARTVFSGETLMTPGICDRASTRPPDASAIETLIRPESLDENVTSAP